MSRFFTIALGALGFVVMDSGQIAKENAGDNSDDDDDDDDDGDSEASVNPDDTVRVLRDNYAEIFSRVPSPAWLLTHAPFNAVQSRVITMLHSPAGATIGRDDESHGLAAAFGARLPCRRGAQAASS